MAMKSIPPVENHPPWWKERMVWLVIALPLSAVLAGIATVFIAAHDPDDLVKAEVVKTGMTTVAPHTPLEQAARMGLDATLSYGGGEINVQLSPPAMPLETLHLTLVHPTRAELDTQIPLLHLGQGKYHARIELTGQGKRHLILEPPDQSWRLEGEWRAPFNEETSLRAGTQNPSTHP
jgi:hypothetical protein